jgi:hypothetical protein
MSFHLLNRHLLRFVQSDFIDILERTTGVPSGSDAIPRSPPEIANPIGVNIEADSYFLRPCLIWLLRNLRDKEIEHGCPWVSIGFATPTEVFERSY